MNPDPTSHIYPKGKVAKEKGGSISGKKRGKTGDKPGKYSSLLHKTTGGWERRRGKKKWNKINKDGLQAPIGSASALHRLRLVLSVRPV